MENAVQALKTAAAVLIFVIAITTTFVMFSKAKVTADAVISTQDRQKYLDSPEVSGGILYTSKEDIENERIKIEDNPTMTKDGYRIVDLDDIIATLYRYSIEKYGVTVIKENGDIIARFDSNTESYIIPNWNTKYKNKHNDIINKLKENTKVKVTINGETKEITPKFSDNSNNIQEFEKLYKYKYTDNAGIHENNISSEWFSETYNSRIRNSEIIRHINSQISGSSYVVNGHTYSYTANLKQYESNKFVEILNTIDTSKYLEDTNENDETVKTTLQTQYQMPTIEIIYILQE